jgi:hypothetical protein
VDLPELLFGGDSLDWLVVFCTEGQWYNIMQTNKDSCQQIALGRKSEQFLKKMNMSSFESTIKEHTVVPFLIVCLAETTAL